MQVRAGHAAGRADAPNDLAALDRITHHDERAAQVKIDGHQTLTVMHVDRYAAVEEIPDERHDAAVRGPYRRPFAAREIEPRMPAAPHAVHLTSGAEGARDARPTWTNERRLPQLGHVVCTSGGVARQREIGPGAETTMSEPWRGVAGCQLMSCRNSVAANKSNDVTSQSADTLRCCPRPVADRNRPRPRRAARRRRRPPREFARRCRAPR